MECDGEKKMKIYPLNSIEKNMLAWDREDLAFNSHLVADFDHPLEADNFLKAHERLFKEIPLLRTIIQNNERYVQDKMTSDKPLIEFQEISEDVETEFLNRPFNLASDSPYRALYGKLTKEESTWRLIMTVHHTSFDGIAQTYLFREIMLAYQGLPLTPWTTTILPFRFRDLFKKKFSFSKRYSLYFNLLKSLNYKKPQAATLITHPERASRKVRHEYFDLGARGTDILNAKGRELKLSFYEVIFLAILKTLDKTVTKKDDKPIVLAIPMNFRTFLKVDHFFQNVVGLMTLRFTRNEVQEKNIAGILKEKIKESSAHQLTLRPAFLAAITSKIFGINTLRKIMLKNDLNPNAIYSSILISALRFSSSVMVMPPELTPKRLLGHGSLFKSPGLGVIVTGTKENQVVVIEYLEDLFSPETIVEFKKTLITELGLDP